ncbi:methyltransferase [Actibacterium mucosum KCTC 23349]|uniref:Methyltransferase n=1 Tax=Actibacterium mucosum KCTC 23349 TaxID=1454373 RepID=A0A037ZMQ6_9RHOB|nr:methyltransferase [Actibacterium mucosum]KAJ56111.1 methyltransferase [Actibacterium mucosum KCTC 23349]
MNDDLTHDRFLGDRLHVWQPRAGYRAGVDPVLLAASVNAKTGQSVLELGCGVGVASLCLGRRVPGLRLTGLELQPGYADLARRNAAENDVPFDVVQGDLAQMPAALRQQSFDHVIANPPYFLQAENTGSDDDGRDTALRGETPLAQWVKAGMRRLKPRGMLCVIQRVERLPELLSLVAEGAGAIEVLPVSGRAGRAPGLILLRAIKGARTPFRLHPPLIMHDGAQHPGDFESYTTAVSAVLREGAALPWPDA